MFGFWTEGSNQYQKCSYNISLVCSSDRGWAGCTTSQSCAGMVTLKMRRNTNPLPTDYTQVPIESKFMVVCGMACVGGVISNFHPVSLIIGSLNAVVNHGLAQCSDQTRLPIHKLGLSVDVISFRRSWLK